MRKINKNIDQNYIDNKENYNHNKNKNIESFNLILKEIKNKICDTEFAKSAIFNIIKEQEKFIAHINKRSHAYANLKEEKEILNNFIKETKLVFDKEYLERYKKCLKS